MLTKAELRKKFDELPDKIREWLTSERATYIVIDINGRLGMIGPLVKIIPTTILRLVTKDIEPNDFTNVLSAELDLDFGAAKNIAQEIEEKILRPVEALLRKEADIDIKLIYLAQPRAVVSHPEAQPKDLEILRSTQNDLVINPPVRNIPTPPMHPQNRPTFQPIRPAIVRLPINTPKNGGNL